MHQYYKLFYTLSLTVYKAMKPLLVLACMVYSSYVHPKLWHMNTCFSTERFMIFCANYNSSVHTIQIR